MNSARDPLMCTFHHLFCWCEQCTNKESKKETWVSIRKKKKEKKEEENADASIFIHIQTNTKNVEMRVIMYESLK